MEWVHNENESRGFYKNIEILIVSEQTLFILKNNEPIKSLSIEPAYDVIGSEITEFIDYSNNEEREEVFTVKITKNFKANLKRFNYALKNYIDTNILNEA